MRTLILFFILIIHLVIAGEFIVAQEIKASEPYIDVGYMQGLDTGGHGLPASLAYPDYYRGEIHIIEAYIKVNEVHKPFGYNLDKCNPDYKINAIGWCVPLIDFYRVIPVHLISKDVLFEVCTRPGQILPRGIAGCFNNWDIYIINGAQGLPPSNQGCSILYHELKHAEGLFDPEIAQRYPNERCAVSR